MCIRWDKWTAQSIRWSDRVREWIPDTDWKEGLDTFPGYESPIVFQPPPPWGEKYRMTKSVWGIPLGKGPRRVLHARSETIRELPMFRDLFRVGRRCIFPMAAFYEQLDGRWVRFREAHGEPLAVAGLYRPPRHSGELGVSVMVTCAPNATVAPAQDRMPVLLRDEDWATWLDPKASDRDLTALMIPAPSDLLIIGDAGPNGRKGRLGSAELSLFAEEDDPRNQNIK